MKQPGRTYIRQGEHAVGGPGDQEITTILGSCVAVCLWDGTRQVGGMNHILLPDGVDGAGDRFGAFEMESLINALIKTGARRVSFEAKVFGGASMLDGLTDIGARNAAFVLSFLASEGIPVRAQNTGGTRARQVRFDPGRGTAKLRMVSEAPPDAEKPVVRRANDVELF